MDSADDTGMLMGAKAIAREAYGDEKHWRRIYPNVDGLPLFRYRGQICSFKGAQAHREAVRARKVELQSQMTKHAETARFLPEDAAAA
jgi:hypothetical protein